MNALKRILAMVMVIAMLMSMAVAEGDVLLIDQSGEIHVHEELEAALIEDEAAPAALEELVFELPEETVEEIPAEEPAVEETEPELGLSELPEMIAPEEEAVIEEVVEVEGDLVEIELIQTEGSGCDHSNSYFSYEERQNITWTDMGELDHFGTCDTIEWYWCRDCQVHVALGGETGVSFTEEHNWQQARGENGERAFSCNDCGYINTCAHNFAVTDTWRINENYVDNQDGTHTATFGDGWDETCSICGAVWTENSEDVQTIVEGHDWRNGYYNASLGAYVANCWYCEAENTCEHSFELTDEIISYYAGNAVDNGDGTHTKYFYVVNEYTCSKCGGNYRLEDNETVHEATEGHEWSDYGQCNWCEAYLSDNCDHPYAQPEGRWYANFELTSANDDTHSGTCDIEQEYYCPDCDSWYYKITETGVVITNEAHDWHYDWETDAETGEEYLEKHCNVCHYVDYCEHSFVVTDVESEWEYDCGEDANNGDGTHTVTYYDGYRYECEACGAFYWETDRDNGHVVTEPHSWWYDEEYDETICRYCDATNDCDHVFTTEWDGYWVQDCWDNGDGTHTREYYDVYRTECEICGAYNTYDGEELQVETEPHDFYDGECRECPAKNNCAHANVVEDGVSEYYDAVVHAADEKSHTISAYYCTWYICQDCGQSFQEISDEFTTVNETLPHEWTDEGYCWVCDMENPCQHPNLVYENTYMQTDWDMDNPIISTTLTSHTIWAYECEEGQCPDCGVWMFNQIGETIQYTAAHEYYGRNSCMVCDYIPSCAHTTRVTQNSYYYIGEADKVDNIYHTSYAKPITMTICVACGHTTEVIGTATYGFMERHYYDASGNCVECDHQNTCKHVDTDTYTYDEEVKCFDGNSTGHRISMQRVQATECTYCGDVLSEKVISTWTETERVPHMYDVANTCTHCGYQTTCTHKNYTFSAATDVHYNAVNAYQHVAIHSNVNAGVCLDCASVLYYCSSYNTIVGALGYHSFVDGYCTLCYLPQPGVCQHKYENGECVKCGVPCTHAWDGCVCTICGTEAHEWDGCVCTKCGEGEHAVGLNDCYCEDCDQTVHDVVNHVCTRCGLCNHEHPFGSVCEPCKWCGYTEHVEENFTSKIAMETTGYKDLSAEGVIGYHAEIRTATMTTACTVCGQIVSEEPAPEYDEEVNNSHTFRSNEDACIDCGAAKPECPSNWDTGLHEDNGNGMCQHCWYCMFHFDDEPDDPDMYDDWGECINCYYYNAEFDPANDGHTHVPNYSWYGMAEDSEVVYLDAQRHVIIGKQVQYAECEICSAVYETETGLDEVRWVEEHYNWDEENGSSFCEGCGAYMVSNSCVHENTYEEPYIARDWSQEAVSYNNHTHSAYGWEVTNIYCADCGEWISDNYSSVIDTDPALYEMKHDITWWWDEDNQQEVQGCDGCGYIPVPCAKHTWTIEPDYDDGNYVSLDQNNHAFYGVHSYIYTCSVCSVKEYVEEHVANEVSLHNYENGICADCGAKLIELDGVVVNGLDENNSITIGYMMPYQLDYDVIPANSAVKPVFTSSNRYIASVDQNGLITGMYPGSAVITISANNTENAFEPVQFTVVVGAAPTAVNVQDAPYGGDMLAVGETVQLNPTVLPAGVMHNLTWTSSHPAVATVDENGLVKGVGAGLALISVKTQNGKADTYLVKVAAAAERMDLGIDGNALEMGLGMTWQIAPVMTPAGAGSEITYVSSNPEVASVTAAGKITALSAGEATITVSTWGLDEQEIAIEVKAAPTSVSFARTAVTASLTEGTMQLKPIIGEDEATHFTWISGNNNIASVDANGLVTFKRAGTVLIAAMAHNGKFATCLITVMPYAPSKITVEPAVLDMLVGESKELKISFGPYEGCSDLKISQSEYFTYEDGILTALKVTDEPVELVFEAPNSTEENPVKGTCTVNIYPELAEIAITAGGELAAESMKLSVGQIIDLGVERKDVNGDAMFAGDYTVSSTNTGVATVLNNKLYVLGMGKTVITVTAYNGAEDSLEIEAVAAPYYVTISPTTATLGMGEKAELSISHVYPESPTTYTVVSTNENVAKVVEEDGKYYVVAGNVMGVTNVIVGTHNGKYAACRVVVYNAPTGITLDKSELNLAAGEKAKLASSLTPLYSAGVITWKSSDESVAKVENGEVIAVGKGSAIITAETYNSTADAPVIAECAVTVKNAPASIVIEMDDTMSVGQNQPVKVKLLDENGEETTGAYTISSNYPLFATVLNGSVYARYATLDAYPVYITVNTFNDVEEQVQLKIVAAPYYVTMTPAAATLGMGEKMELSISHVSPEAPTTYTVLSTNESVAKVVEEDGKYYVEAGDKMGFANIIVGTHNGKYAFCRVVVYNAPTGITLDKSELTLAAGEKAKLTSSLTPLYSAGAVRYKSSDESIVKVENGELIAVKAGTATITAETYNSTADAPVKAECVVTVKNAPASVVFEMADTMSVGQNQAVKVKLLDENGEETTGAYTVESNYPLFALLYNGSVYARYATLEAYPVYLTVKTFNDVEAKLQLNIVAAPIALQFSQSSVDMKLGTKGNVNEAIKVLPEGTPTNLIYASSNPNVVTVNADGEVEAVAEGIARITVASHNGKYAFLWITVKQDVGGEIVM